MGCGGGKDSCCCRTERYPSLLCTFLRAALGEIISPSRGDLATLPDLGGAGARISERVNCLPLIEGAFDTSSGSGYEDCSADLSSPLAVISTKRPI